MKKLLVVILIFALLLSVNAFALGKASLKCTVYPDDLSGTNFRLYFIKCTGHYSRDTVTVYITNTSDKPMKFQVMVGYAGATVQTTVESGYVEIPKGVTGRFELNELSKYHEKTNDELTYDPNVKLSANSVVQIMVQDAYEGATFVVTGIDSFQSVRNTNFALASSNVVVTEKFVPAYVTQSRLVIKRDEPVNEGEAHEYTLSQPDNQSIRYFVKITAGSLSLGMVATVIYALCHKKRRNNND